MTVRVLSLSAALLTVTMAGDALPRATPESVGLSSPRLREATGLLQQFVTGDHEHGLVARRTAASSTSSAV